MAHEIVEAAEAILDKEFPVLDHGFVRLVDYLGGDARIVQSARVSYGEGTKSFRQDKGLINYLLRNEHTSPFEQVVFTFHTKMPIFVARQWVRHRTARLNEISGRYSVMKEEFYLPDSTVLAPQSADNKQGRSEARFDREVEEQITAEFAQGQHETYAAYERLLDAGLARELARINLPLSTYTEWYWQIDLHNLFHFLKLRLDAHAQYEIRVYAEVMHEIAMSVCPIAVDAFEEHVRGGVRLSRSEIEVLRSVLDDQEITRAAQEAGLQGRAVERLVHKVRFGHE